MEGPSRISAANAGLVGAIMLLGLAATFAAFVPSVSCPECATFNIETIFDRKDRNYYTGCAQCNEKSCHGNRECRITLFRRWFPKNDP